MNTDRDHLHKALSQIPIGELRRRERREGNAAGFHLFWRWVRQERLRGRFTHAALDAYLDERPNVTIVVEHIG